MTTTQTTSNMIHLTYGGDSHCGLSYAEIASAYAPDAPMCGECKRISADRDFAVVVDRGN
jgi:hypothetical protein